MSDDVGHVTKRPKFERDDTEAIKLVREGNMQNAGEVSQMRDRFLEHFPCWLRIFDFLGYTDRIRCELISRRLALTYRGVWTHQSAVRFVANWFRGEAQTDAVRAVCSRIGESLESISVRFLWHDSRWAMLPEELATICPNLERMSVCIAQHNYLPSHPRK